VRKLFLLTLVMLLSTICLEAQDAAGAKMTGPTMLVGCLAYTNGNYLLTDKSGNIYQLSSNNPNIFTHHVGHQIKVAGKAVAPASNSRTRDTAMQSASSSARDQRVFQVRSVTPISDTCESNSK
jgi:hypothetical protein